VPHLRRRLPLPDFLLDTRAVRDGDWTCAPIPADIVDRRVETILEGPPSKRRPRLQPKQGAA